MIRMGSVIKMLDQARKFTNTLVHVKADKLPDLPDGEYYHHEIIGMKVLLESGEVLGTVKEIVETGANDVYVVTSVTGDKKEILIPAIDEVLLEIDVSSKQMKINPLPGLLPARWPGG